jgi:hypothetical protein
MAESSNAPCAAERLAVLPNGSDGGRRFTRYPDASLGASHLIVERQAPGKFRTHDSESRRKTARAVVAMLVVVLAAASGQVASAREWYVAPLGTKTAKGTKDSPWDIDSALGGKQKVAPGDTIWLMAGTYKRPFENLGKGYPVRLTGRKESPIHVRGVPGERVIIDGGLQIVKPTDYLWLWDVEILVSEPRPKKPLPPAPHYKNLDRPWGGLNIDSGTGCKYINVICHDNCQGVSWWSGSTNSELHGCIIYDNGWVGTDRGNGHAIYTQNENGTKVIANCIFSGGHGSNIHAYGSKEASVNKYLIESNICYNAGEFHVGGYKPSENIRVFQNTLYNVSMQLGFRAAYNEDCEVRNNLIINGELAINKFKKVVDKGNLALPKGDPRTRGTRIVLNPNKYDAARAQLGIYNGEGKSAVVADLGKFLKKGDKFRLMSATDFYGKPVLKGDYAGTSIRIPAVKKQKVGNRDVSVPVDFAAFVVLKEPVAGKE